ncbi:IPT/TIG domain-containing protein [Dactylosporangium sp. AC04546]|uniref:IPT/TIG domain-containing protein n=1 Tax=Dactylosporangium sp. AC04546 TaxID=2862460 RepID=UPI001EDDDE35|nr:IPT/TIG domain-containing protein [Dactylosporangium sp. AC04546]WVK83055.1 IPT/TIG domain-containing protein [Dactylosporangium sp. AC04546]
MQVSKRLPGVRLVARAAVVLGLVASGLVATATPSLAAGDPITTVAPAHGPSGGGNSITLTPTTAGTFTGATLANVIVQFSFAACGDPLVGQTPITSSAGAVTAGVVRSTATATLSGNNLVVAVPSTLTLPVDVTAPTPFYVCAYDGSTVGSTALLAETAGAAYTVNPLLTANPASGASGGGYSLDVTTPNPIFTPFTTTGLAVQFQAKTATGSVCAAVPQGASAPAASNASTITGGVVVATTGLQVPTARSLKVQVPTTMVQPFLSTLPTVLSSTYNICVYSAGTLAAETSPAAPFILSGNVAMSSASGPPAGGNAITLTAAGPIFTSGSTFVQFQSTASNHNTCDSFYSAAGTTVSPTAAQTRFISTSKLAVTVPAITAGSYIACVYDATTGSGDHLVAQAFGTYVSGAVPTITSVSPATGPAQGGTTITVTGSGLPTAAGSFTAAVGGVPMQVTPVNATSFTAITPPHAPGSGFAISITLTNGNTYEGKNLFTFTNGIAIYPVTAPNSKLTGTDIDVQGVGFLDLTFAAAGVVDPNSSKSHVYLVKGAYDPKAGNPATSKTNGQVAECVDVLVISDTNLLCSLYTAGNGPLPTNAGRIMTGCTMATAANTTVVPGVGCSFNPSDVGMTIAGTNIPAATTVTAVNATTGGATISKAITTAVSAATPLVLNATTTKVIPDATSVLATDPKKITTVAATFAATDVGKAIYGTNVPTGSVITEYVDSKNVKISGTITTNVASAAASPLFMVPSGPVSNGTYTLTVVSNGIINAATVTPALTPPYVQSIISSGSTFTVADYLLN